MYLILSKACFFFCFLCLTEFLSLTGQVLSELLYTLGQMLVTLRELTGLEKDKEQMTKPPQSGDTVQT